jgi:hypothetical protein
MKSRHRTRFITLLLLLLALSACAVESDRTDKPGPDWSRGLILGRTNLRQPVALAVDAEKHVHMVWPYQGLRYVQLDAQAQILVDETLDIDLFNLRRPRLLVDRQDSVHLAWLSRDRGIQRLYHATISSPGEIDTPRLLSREGENVTGYQMYLSPGRDVGFVWAGEPQEGDGGLFHATLRAPTPATLLASPCLDPYVTVDGAGTVHLAWLRERGLTSRTIYYATLQDGDSAPALVPAEGQKLTDFEFNESAITYGPLIGLDTQTVYVTWSIQNQGGGLTPTSAFSYYVAFAPGAPQVSNPRSIGLPTPDRPTYDDHASPYGMTKLDLLSQAEPGYSSDFVAAPATVSGQESELPVAFSLMTYSTAGSEIQLATTLLSEGEQVGYQLASKTTNASLVPTMVADTDTNLHLAWIDTAGFREYRVHYATLAPQARQWLDRTSGNDLVLGAARVVFGVLSGIGLLPIAGIWSFPAMVWVVVFFIATGKEEMARTATKVGFAIAVAIYVGMKALLLPGLFNATPFLYAVPRGWATVVGIVVPLIILALAGLAVYLYARRAERPTIFMSFLIFAMTDVVLTMVLYSPGFFGRS